MRWGEQLERGYHRGFSVRFEGIPFVFVERYHAAVETDLPVTAPSQRAISEGLVLSSDSEVSTDLDRQTGVARGRALDIRLDLDAMTSAAQDMFRIASIRAPLDGNVTNPAATTIALLDTSTLSTAGSGWIGREHVTWTGKASGIITGVTRGVAGLPHWHTSNSASGYGFLTDRPTSWRGRFVELWEHLLSPDGRMLDASFDGGTYSGVLWRGFVEAQPEIDARTVQFRALPLERITGRELGTSTEGRILSRPFAFRSTGFRPVTVLAEPTDKLTITKISNGETAQVPFDFSGPTDVYQWASVALRDAQIAFPGLASWGVNVSPQTNQLAGEAQYLWLLIESGYRVESSAWFLEEVPFLLGGWVGRIISRETVPLWVFVDVGRDVAGRPEPWPASGFATISAGSGAGELVRFDAIDTTFVNDGVVGVRIVQRGLAGTRPVDIFGGERDPTIAVVAGHVGLLSECLRTLLTSSGTGARGPFDTLPPGYGYGIPDAWLDLDEYPLSFDVCEAVGEAESTVEELLGGWLAARQLCLAQVRRGADVVLRALPTWVLDAAALEDLTASDIVLGTAQSQGLLDTPNTVIFERSQGDEEVSIRVRDVPRVASEGERAWSFLTPSIEPERALSLGLNLMRMSDGQLAARCSVRPRFRSETGDMARVVAAHPEFYDWRIGDTGTDILGRVMGWTDNLFTGETARTFLLPAGAIASAALCPSAMILARPSSTEVRVSEQSAAGFEVGYAVCFYVAGAEDTLFENRIITGRVAGGGNVTFTLAAALDVTDFAAGAWMSYESGYNAEQDRHAFYLGARWL